MPQRHHSVVEAVNRVIDRIPRVELRVGRWRVPAYGTGVATGVMSSLVLIEAASLVRGLSLLTAAAAFICALVTALALAAATRVTTGSERFTYFHYAVAVVGAVALLLSAFGVPALPYVDLIALGMTLCLTTGRVGCLMAGCCHGRPAGWGVRYGAEHAAEGFTPHLVGVRLFPLQALEALGIGLITALGFAAVVRGAAAGAALAWTAVAYSTLRFILEFMRGDCDRPYLWGCSEGQWTSVLLAAAVVVAERNASLPHTSWHAAAAIGLGATALGLAVLGRGAGVRAFGFLGAHDIRDLVETIDRLDRQVTRDSDDVLIASTCGVRVSAGRTHYTLSSSERRPLSMRLAGRIAGLIRALNGGVGDPVVVQAGPGIFHAVITTAREPQVVEQFRRAGATA